MAVRKTKRIGQTINGYTILDSNNSQSGTIYTVKCEKCGHIQEKRPDSVLKRNSQCEKCGKKRIDHNASGAYGTPIYERYMRILTRIRQHEEYENIEMCDEWLHDFTKFRDWSFANGFRPELTIDRIDNSKGYSPDNCRWVDLKTQANNRTSNKIYTYNGETMTVAQLCDKYGVPRQLVYGRLKYGWSIEDAIEKPIDTSRRTKAWKSKHGK